MTDLERNNNHVTYIWVAGILAIIVVASGGAWASGIMNRVDRIEVEQPAGFERISALEARSNSVDARLDRIEQKIDKLLERK